MLHWQGLTEITYRNFTPLSLMNNDPAGVQVNNASPHRDVKSLADAIKASRPGQLKASGTGQGGIWHLCLAGWLGAMGMKADHVRWVPSNGAAPAMQDLAAGGIDFTTCSVPEARAMLDAGRARSLAVMGAERLSVFPNVPTLKEAMGVDYQNGAWRGIAGPPGIPAGGQGGAGAGAPQGVQFERVQGVPERPRLRPHLRRRGGLRAPPGSGQRLARRGHEGGGAGQGLSGPIAGGRPRPKA